MVGWQSSPPGFVEGLQLMCLYQGAETRGVFEWLGEIGVDTVALIERVSQSGTVVPLEVEDIGPRTGLGDLLYQVLSGEVVIGYQCIG